MAENRKNAGGGPDLSLPLPEAEEEMMFALWSCGGNASFYELQNALPPRDSRSPATLVNLLYHLEKKGYLAISKKSPRVNLYRALVSRRDYAAARSRRLLDRCWGGSLYALCRELIYTCSAEELDKLFHLAEEETAGRYGGDSDLYDPWMG